MSPSDRLARVTATLEATLIRLQEVEAERDRLATENAALRARQDAGGTSVDLVLENADLRDQVTGLTEKLEVMHYRMAQMTRRLFGSTSERHDPDQQVLDEVMRQIRIENALAEQVDDGETVVGALAGDQPAADSTSGTPPSDQQPPKDEKKPKKKARGRLTLPAHLPVEDRRIEVPESERLGPDGTPLPEVGAEVTWKLDFIPAWFRRLRIIRPIYRTPFSDEPRIIAPPLACVVPHGLPTDETVAMVLVEKYDYHMPLYRQETKLERAGIDLSRATLMNWVKHGATLLAPIQQAIGDAIRSRPVIGLDDTWIDVLEPGAGETHQSYLWGYFAEDEFYCEYRRSREGRWPAEFLAGYSGTAMADAYGGHQRLFTSGDITSAGCMAHARRKFDEAHEAGEVVASQALDLFTLLWRVEDRGAGLEPQVRCELRQAEAVPVLNRLEALLTEWLASQRPSSGLYRAARYTLKIFPQLRTYTRDGRVPIDNNALERQWRQPSLNRKNSLFVGSDRGGDWAATMFTIMQSCRLADIDPYRYLVDIFAELHRGRTDYHQLRPMAWARRSRVAAA